MTDSNHSSSRREGGFGLIEAVIAGVLLLIVGTAAAGALVSTVKTQSKLSLNERRIAVAEGVFERLKSESSWMRPAAANCQSMPIGATTRTCNATWLNTNFEATTLVNQSGSASPVRYRTNIRIVGIDDDYDGQGANDRDGTRPDYYAARVGVRRTSTEPWFNVEGVIDPPGRVATGALVISVCRVSRQYDERIPLSGCPAPKPQHLLGYPAAGPGAGGTNAAHDWEAALNRAGSGGNWNMVTFGLRSAIGVQVEIEQYPDASGFQRDAVPASWTPPAGCTSSGGNQTVRCTIGSGPERVVSGLIPGRYSVNVIGVPNGYEPWRLQSIPSNNTAIVEKGRRSRVLQVVRPVNRAFYDVSLWSCDHSEVQSWGTGPCVNSMQPSGISAWLAPAPSSRAAWSNFASAGTGANRIRFTNLTPGLYSARMVTSAKGSLPLHQGPAASGSDLRFLWVNPVANGVPGGDAPNSGTASWTRHWCDYARRVAFLSGVGLGPGGGNIPHTHYTYNYSTTPPTITGSYVHQHYYYPATACQSSGGGGGPPGAGSGGA